MNRRGMALILVLVMSALIGMSAMLLFSTTNMETMISGNVRRINQAKMSSMSGLNHFTALRFDYDALREQAGDLQTLQILSETRLSDRTFYEVKVHFCCGLNEGEYIVESIGYYKKSDKILASKITRALFSSGQTN